MIERRWALNLWVKIPNLCLDTTVQLLLNWANDYLLGEFTSGGENNVRNYLLDKIKNSIIWWRL